MLSLLLLGVIIFVAGLLLLINAFILWDSETLLINLNTQSSTTYINIWAVVSLIAALIFFAISLYMFWEYYKITSVEEKVKDTLLDVVKRRVKASKLLSIEQ